MTGDFSAWIGKEEVRTDRIEPARSNALLAALGQPGAAQHGDPLPELHHWLYFWDVRPPAEIGADGHPAKGGFLPPVPLPRRMWAGGRLRFEAPLHFGDSVEKRSRIAAIETKEGRTGTLVFVTVEHSLTGPAGLAIREEQDLVYRAAGGSAAPLPQPLSGPPSCDAHLTVHPDSLMLFRFSALTMNGHRIHYDRPYTLGEEGYPALLVHGPLQAALLAGLARAQAGRPLKTFDFRGQQPAYDGIDLHACCTRTADCFELWTQQGEARNLVATAS